jgi:hypothetical protein
MPATVSLYLAAVWCCVGFCVGLGWAVAALLVGRLAR